MNIKLRCKRDAGLQNVQNLKKFVKMVPLRVDYKRGNYSKRGKRCAKFQELVVYIFRTNSKRALRGFGSATMKCAWW